MLIASAYHEAKERADRLVDSQIRYNKELAKARRGGTSWWTGKTPLPVLSTRHAPLSLKKKPRTCRTSGKLKRRSGLLDRFGEWGARKYIGLMGEENTHETTVMLTTAPPTREPWSSKRGCGASARGRAGREAGHAAKRESNKAKITAATLEPCRKATTGRATKSCCNRERGRAASSG